MIARATFVVRAASQRFPGMARALKRMLGLPADGQAGATAWADAPPAQPRARRTGEPHIAFTPKPSRPELDTAASDNHGASG